MGFVLAVVIIAVLILTGILINQKRQVHNICRQLAFLKDHESNMLITRNTDLGGIGELVEELNELLVKQRRLYKEYLAKERIISETYTSLSHDIRTPLTSLDGYFQLLEQSEDPEEQKRYLEIIQERISSLKEMLEELFTFTKLKNEAYELELSPCMVNRIVKETLFSYYEEWTARQITPEFELAEEPLCVMGNETALRRVLQNLLKNGLEHGEKTIHICLKRQEDKVCLEVRNHVKDPGKMDVTQVFERFYKADEVRSRNSTGLGLSIAREFVLRMNGTIEAVLEENEFCVRIRLPEHKG
ncbi:MAG: sensor histidine kinase [Lachnospiraceae bacterium]